MITWREVLQELHRCDGQITDYGHPVGQSCSIRLSAFRA